MEGVASGVVKLGSTTSKADETTHLSYTPPPPPPPFSTHLLHPPPPPLQKLRPVRSPIHPTFSADTAHNMVFPPLHPPPPPQQQGNFDDEMSAETLMRMKAEMDATLLHSFRSQISNLPLSLSSSSECSGDSVHQTGEDPPPNGSLKGDPNRRKKKRKKFESFIENLMSQLTHKQEQMHQQLMDLIETKERERISRDEQWRRLEMERAKRDQEVRSQEAARSLALISFIQTALGGQHVEIPPHLSSAFLNRDDADTKTPLATEGDQDKLDPTYKRWPTSEVQALITLRAALDHKFHAHASKASAWEEISAAMATMGFNRNARKCKEKWENINKYYKKATSSGRPRSENAKTCPYFHELETLFSNRLITNGKFTSPSCDNAEVNGKV